MNKRMDKKKQKQLNKVQTQSAQSAPAAISVPENSEAVSFHIQYQNQEYLASDIIEKVKEKCKTDGASSSDLKELSIYLKPADKKAYYVLKNTNGFIEL